MYVFIACYHVVAMCYIYNFVYTVVHVHVCIYSLVTMLLQCKIVPYMSNIII